MACRACSAVRWPNVVLARAAASPAPHAARSRLDLPDCLRLDELDDLHPEVWMLFSASGRADLEVPVGLFRSHGRRHARNLLAFPLEAYMFRPGFIRPRPGREATEDAALLRAVSAASPARYVHLACRADALYLRPGARARAAWRIRAHPREFRHQSHRRDRTGGSSIRFTA